jgi:hypothetical protein
MSKIIAGVWILLQVVGVKVEEFIFKRVFRLQRWHYRPMKVVFWMEEKILETKRVEVELSGFEFRGFLAGSDVERFWNFPFHG